jgi:hypothetical protein
MKKLIIMLACIGFAVIGYATTNEITVSSSLKVNKNSTELSKSALNQLVQMAGTRFYSATITATTTNQALSKGNVGNLGWCYWRNCSTNKTLYMSTGNGASTNFCLLPGEAGVFRLAPSCVITTIQVSASSGAADLDLTVVEE